MSVAPVEAPRTTLTDGLALRGLSVSYGDVVAVDNVTVEVAPGEIVALLGANGAGKSSLLNAASGLVPAAGGTVVAGGRDLTGEIPEVRARYVSQVPEGRRLFAQHTVAENLMLAAFGASRSQRRERLEEVHAVLPRLAELADRQAYGLSGGEQQMVALGRGLMSSARVLMIDELSLGLAPLIASQFAVTLRELRERGYAILLVEQYVGLALSVSDRVVTLARGRVAAEGTPDDLLRETEVLQRAYLGGGNQALLEREADARTVEAQDAAAPGLPPRRRFTPGVLLTGGGAVAFAACSFAPWLQFDTGLDKGTLALRHYPTTWLAGLLALAAACLMIAAVRVIRAQPAGRVLGILGFMIGVAFLGAAIWRTWILDRGIPNPDFARHTRDWGNLLGLYAAAVACVGTRSLWVERRTAAETAGEG